MTMNVALPSMKGGAVLLVHSSRGSAVQLAGARARSTGAHTSTHAGADGAAPTSTVTSVVGELTCAGRPGPNDTLAVGVTAPTAGAHVKLQVTVWLSARAVPMAGLQLVTLHAPPVPATAGLVKSPPSADTKLKLPVTGPSTPACSDTLTRVCHSTVVPVMLATLACRPLMDAERGRRACEAAEHACVHRLWGGQRQDNARGGQRPAAAHHNQRRSRALVAVVVMLICVGVTVRLPDRMNAAESCLESARSVKQAWGPGACVLMADELCRQ